MKNRIGIFVYFITVKRISFFMNFSAARRLNSFKMKLLMEGEISEDHT